MAGSKKRVRQTTSPYFENGFGRVVLYITLSDTIMETENPFDASSEKPSPHVLYIISSICVALVLAATLVSGALLLADSF